MEIIFKNIDEVAVTDTLAVRYSDLRSQLKGKPYHISRELLEEVAARKDSELLLFLYVDGEVAGMAQASFICVPQSESGYINAVVVDDTHRGHGLGTTLVEELHMRAKARWPQLQHFVLTSAPSRNTQGFYTRLGYRMRTKEAGDETTFYIKDL